MQFDQLPPTARVWIYQAPRPLTPAEAADTAPLLAHFVRQWASHGRPLRAAAEWRHGWFLLLGVDETAAPASGCSIDASVQLVRELGQRLGLDLLDKSRLAFRRDDIITARPLAQLRAAVAAGAVQADDFYFDNTLTTKGQLDAQWPAPAATTWLRRYFAAAPVAALGA